MPPKPASTYGKSDCDCCAGRDVVCLPFVRVQQASQGGRNTERVESKEQWEEDVGLAAGKWYVDRL